jgi:hypothetical protein
MTWQNPWAWAGLATLALPVLVHLLSRAPAVLRPFPSLRFIDASRLSPRRRTRPRDPLLLLVRLGILAAAVAALAGPSFGRGAARSPRVVRAIVLDTSASMLRPVAQGGSRTVLDSARHVAAGMAVAGDERDATTIVVASAQPSNAIPGVLTWLKAQPGSHEIVLVSDFQRDAMDSAALRETPPAYGIRLVRVAGAALDSSFTIPAEHPATDVHVVARAEETELRWSSARDTTQAPVTAAAASHAVSHAASYTVTLRASDAERARLRAAVSATVGAASLGTRVHLDSAPVGRGSMHAVEIVYPGFAGRAALLARATVPSAPWMTETTVRLAADPVLQELARASGASGASGASRTADTPTRTAGAIDSAFPIVARTADGRAVVRAAQDTAAPGVRMLLFTRADAESALSAALVAATLHASAPTVPLQEREPLDVGDAELASWARAATDTGAAAAPSSDATRSQGRWLWALALALVGVETLLRRAATPRSDEAVAA